LGGLDVTLINLDRRPDRLATVSAALKRAAGAEFASRCRRYAAVDGKDLVLDDELRHLFRGNDFGFRRGVVGCALSHLGVWREVIEAGRPRLILEDDVEFAAHFAERLADLLEVASQLDDVADVIQLGYFPWVNRANDDLFLPRDHPPLTAMRWDRFLGGTFGYVLYPEGARKLIEIAERDGVQRGIDVFLRDQHPAVRTLEAVPHLVLSQVALAGNGVDSDSQHDMTPVASPGAAGSPVAVKVLADLAASTKVGELRIDVVPAWPVAGLSISSDADGFTLLARTEEPGGDGAASYRVALAEDLAIAAIDPLREPDPQSGGSDPPATPAVSVPGGRLAVISESRGPRAVRHRFVLLGAEDEVTARSEVFTFVNAPGAGSEACGGIAERGGRLVIAFTVGESVSGLAVLSLDEALRTLGPVR
jgi:glycosyl transferase family 25